MDILNVCLPGSIDPADSYSIIGIELAKGLTDLGCYVNLLALGKRELDAQDDQTRMIIDQPVRASLGGILCGYPTGYDKFPIISKHGKRIALTMFESTKLPAGWVEVLNAVDAVITPSHFCKEVFIQCGVMTPIYVFPLGTSTAFNPVQRITQEQKPLTFLAFLDRGERKGGTLALQAFVRAFDSNGKYKLILKCRKPKVNLQITNENIEIVQDDLTEQQLYDLYLRADVLINPHKGEGFGLLPREFARTGGVSLTTEFSGTKDDLYRYALPIRCTTEKADWKGNKTLAGQDCGDWAKVNADDLVETLQETANHFEQLSAWAFHYASPFVIKNYSWQNFSKQVLQLWKEL